MDVISFIHAGSSTGATTSLGIPFKMGDLVVHPNLVLSGLVFVLALSSVSTVQAQVTETAH
jgi:hypothetical protein